MKIFDKPYKRDFARLCSLCLELSARPFDSSEHKDSLEKQDVYRAERSLVGYVACS